MIPHTFGMQFLLVSRSGAMTMPINKVVRALEEGPENDLKFYASTECKKRSKNSQQGAMAEVKSY